MRTSRTNPRTGRRAADGGRSLWLVAALLGGLAAPGAACGPVGPDTLLPNTWGLLQLPRGLLDEELEKLDLPRVEFRAENPDSRWGVIPRSAYAKQTQTAEQDDVRAALTEARLPAGKIDAVVQACLAARRKLDGSSSSPQPVTPAMLQWPQAAAAAPAPKAVQLDLPPDLPEQFAEYLLGAASWRAGKSADARTHWQRVIALPPEHSRYRSVWAAYMIGRSYVDDDPAQAIASFQMCRALARKGYADTPHLAAASLGWQAKAELNRDQPVAAMRLYLAQLATGDRTAGVSLAIVATRIMHADDPALRAALKDPVAREVLLTVAAGEHWFEPEGQVPAKQAATRLLPAVETLNLTDLPGAWRMAWVAYRGGNYYAADRWAQRCPADSAAANWVRSRLLLRAGKTAEAAEALARILAPPTDPAAAPTGPTRAATYDGSFRGGARPMGKQVAGELAMLRLSQSQYVQAIDLLLRNDWLPDAATIATRVLDENEFRRYVDATWPDPDAKQAALRDEHDWPTHPDAYRAAFIRRQLAWRLMRLGRYADAQPYFPASSERNALRTILADLAAGRDESLPAGARAARLLSAAAILGENRWELFGSFDWRPSWMELDSPQRRDPLASRYDAEHIRQYLRLVSPSRDEQQRLQRTASLELHESCNPDHIRAELVWEAAGLLPDESDATAEVLWQAGRWLMYRDPKYADKFYKALVLRCGTTRLGRQADARHWFPVTLPDGEKTVNLAAVATTVGR